MLTVQAIVDPTSEVLSMAKDSHPILGSLGTTKEGLVSSKGVLENNNISLESAEEPGPHGPNSGQSIQLQANNSAADRLLSHLDTMEAMTNAVTATSSSSSQQQNTTATSAGTFGNNNSSNNTSSTVSSARNTVTTNANPHANGSNAKSCAGCGGKILDRFLLHAMDRYWHTNCLKCSCCQAQLGEIGTSCFTKSGMILCKNDYIRLFGSSGTCAACSQSIPASEFVMRAQGNVYHLNCFTCVACNNRLVPGDRYSLINGGLICEHDYPKVLKGSTQVPLRASHKVC